MNTMRKMTLCALLTIFAAAAFAQAAGNRVIIPEDDLEFEANEDFTEVTITRAKWIGSYDYETQMKYAGKSIELPSEIQGIPVIAIGEEAFAARYAAMTKTGIQEIYIPDGVRAIEDSAFAHTDTKAVRLPDGLESIGGGAFYDTGIVSLNIPSSVKTIGSGAFAKCHDLKEVTIPDGIEEIPDGLFRECGLQSVHIPAAVKIIGDRAFSECRALESVELPGQVEFIGSSAFSESGIKTLSLPSRAFIGSSAFADCPNLEAVDVPEGAFYTTGTNTCTLADIISGTKISRTLSLQKKLKDVPVLYARDVILTDILREMLHNGTVKEYDNGEVVYELPKRDDWTVDVVPGRERYSFNSSYWGGPYYSVLEKLRELTGDEYDFDYSTDTLYRPATEEEQAPFIAAREAAAKREAEEQARIAAEEREAEEQSKKDAIATFIQQRLDSSSIKRFIDNLYFVIPVAGDEFYFKDSAGNYSIEVSRKEILQHLNAATGETFKDSNFNDFPHSVFYREATQQEMEQLFKDGHLLTNFSAAYESPEAFAELFTEKKGNLTFTGNDKGNVFTHAGFQSSDVLKAVTVTTDDNGTKSATFADLLTVPAPAVATFTIQRGKGKKAQTLTIDIPVEWDKSSIYSAYFKF